MVRARVASPARSPVIRFVMLVMTCGIESTASTDMASGSSRVDRYQPSVGRHREVAPNGGERARVLPDAGERGGVVPVERPGAPRGQRPDQGRKRGVRGFRSKRRSTVGGVTPSG